MRDFVWRALICLLFLVVAGMTFAILPLITGTIGHDCWSGYADPRYHVKIQHLHALHAYVACFVAFILSLKVYASHLRQVVLLALLAIIIVQYAGFGIVMESGCIGIAPLR